jgi:hypothetical protein
MISAPDFNGAPQSRSLAPRNAATLPGNEGLVELRVDLPSAFQSDPFSVKGRRGPGIEPGPWGRTGLIGRAVCGG